MTAAFGRGRSSPLTTFPTSQRGLLRAEHDFKAIGRGPADREPVPLDVSRTKVRRFDVDIFGQARDFQPVGVPGQE